MRPNPADLATWSEAIAKARAAYNADQERLCSKCGRRPRRDGRTTCNGCHNNRRANRDRSTVRHCRTCGTGPLPRMRRVCDACLVTNAESQRRHRAKNRTQP